MIDTNGARNIIILTRGENAGDTFSYYSDFWLTSEKRIMDLLENLESIRISYSTKPPEAFYRVAIINTTGKKNRGGKYCMFFKKRPHILISNIKHSPATGQYGMDRNKKPACQKLAGGLMLFR